MSDDTNEYTSLETRLGYTFRSRGLLEQALTHKSFLNERPQPDRPDRRDNERLEFLGDAVLDLAVGHLLMETFPLSSEGDLSKVRASLVSEAGLAQVALELAIGEWLFLGRGEEQSGGRHKPSLLADAMEAVMAAVYLDGGFDPALEVVRRLFHVEAARAGQGSDYKTRFQERVQSELKVQPRYVVVAAIGPDHDKTFEVLVTVGDRELARACGKSKKEAEQRAAELALAVLDAEFS